jgi:ribosomal protein L39E
MKTIVMQTSVTNRNICNYNYNVPIFVVCKTELCVTGSRKIHTYRSEKVKYLKPQCEIWYGDLSHNIPVMFFMRHCIGLC